MVRGLFNPTVELNDVALEIIPDSFAQKKGYGDKTVRIQTAGGGALGFVVTDNVATKKGMVKFSLSNNEENREIIRLAYNNPEGNTIRAYEGEIPDNYVSMFIVNEPEWGSGADTTTEIIFEGPPSV